MHRPTITFAALILSSLFAAPAGAAGPDAAQPASCPLIAPPPALRAPAFTPNTFTRNCSFLRTILDLHRKDREKFLKAQREAYVATRKISALQYGTNCRTTIEAYVATRALQYQTFEDLQQTAVTRTVHGCESGRLR